MDVLQMGRNWNKGHTGPEMGLEHLTRMAL